MKKISIYLNHTRGVLSWIFKNSVSTSSVNIQLLAEAHFAPMVSVFVSVEIYFFLSLFKIFHPQP